MRTARWTTPSLRLWSVVTGTSQLPAPFEPNPTLHNALLKVWRIFCPTLYFIMINAWWVHFVETEIRFLAEVNIV